MTSTMAGASIVEWAFFAVVLVVFLTVDLTLHRGNQDVNRTRAIVWSVITILVGLLFSLYVWWTRDAHALQLYLAAFLLEKSLSLDNLFVFLIIFQMLSIPEPHQRVALLWGILGAIVFRGTFIFAGVEILHRWGWVEYILAVLLFLAAWRSLHERPRDVAEGGENKLIAWLVRHLPVSDPQSEANFFVRERGRLKTTPLFVAVIGLELSDVMFAIDSVPAVFSVTREPYLVYSSNIFAILGLRSLYIVLANTIAGLRYLHFGLAAVLAFAGLKILLGRVGLEMPPSVFVASTVLIIGAAVAASLIARK